MIAYSVANAPEIDGVVFFNGVSAANVSDFLTAKIIASNARELYA